MVWLAASSPSFWEAAEVFARIAHRPVPTTSIWDETQRHGERLKAYVQQHKRLPAWNAWFCHPLRPTANGHCGSAWMAAR